MSGEIKYTSTISVEAGAIKQAGYGLTAGSAKIDSLGDTNLPAAKAFAKEANDIHSTLNQISTVINLDINDAMECFIDFENTDKDLGKLLKQSATQRI